MKKTGTSKVPTTRGSKKAPKAKGKSLKGGSAVRSTIPGKVSKRLPKKKKAQKGTLPPHAPPTKEAGGSITSAAGKVVLYAASEVQTKVHSKGLEDPTMRPSLEVTLSTPWIVARENASESREAVPIVLAKGPVEDAGVSVKVAVSEDLSLNFRSLEEEMSMARSDLRSPQDSGGEFEGVREPDIFE